MSLDQTKKLMENTVGNNEHASDMQGLLTNATLECIYAKALKHVFIVSGVK